MTASSSTRASARPRSAAGRALAAAALLLTLLAARHPGALPEVLKVIGQVVFGTAENAATAATVDILTVYASNPTYMRLRAEGLSQTDGARGSRLFGEAQGSTNKALAKAAKAAGVDVVTVPGGVTGGDAPIADLTAQVIELLPVYHVEGKVLTGSVANARLLAEVASAELLAAIPAWQELQGLTEEQPNYHFLRKKAQDAYEKALLRVSRDGGYDGLVERGGITSRLGPVTDLTRLAISVLEP
jgi:hypothetical protein